MAIETNWYVMDNKIGVDLNSIVTTASFGSNPPLPEYPQPPHNLGDRVQGNNGSEWMFVQASVTVSAFNLVMIGVGHKAENLRVSAATSATGLFVYGVAQFKIPTSTTVGNATGGVVNAGDFFWALMKANGGVRFNLDTSVSVAGGAKIYIDVSVPGWVSTTATLNQAIGIVAQASESGADNGAPGRMEGAMFTYPFPGMLVSVPAVSLTA